MRRQDDGIRRQGYGRRYLGLPSNAVVWNLQGTAPFPSCLGWLKCWEKPSSMNAPPPETIRGLVTWQTHLWLLLVCLALIRRRRHTGETGNRANRDKAIGRVRHGSAKRDERARGKLPAGLRAPGRHKNSCQELLGN